MQHRFFEQFENTPIIGMIHLSGHKPVKRAIEETLIYQTEGINGIIVENYYRTQREVIQTLDELSKQDLNISIGINILPNDFNDALYLAKKFGGKFIQLDYIAGKYQKGTPLDVEHFNQCKLKYPNTLILGGVWPKYYQPEEGSKLEEDLKLAKERADAIVVTGNGTGIATPFGKVWEFRKIIGNFPLIVGAGMTPKNAYEQLLIADGAIVGSYFKPNGDTNREVDKHLVRDLMEMVHEARYTKDSKYQKP